MPASDSPTVGYPAGLGRRLGALLYDQLLVIAVWMFTLFVWVITSGGEAVTGYLVQLTLLVEWIAFYLFFWSRQGQTLGMMAWRIRLVSEQGLPPTMKQLALRMLVAPFSFLVVGVGFLWYYIGDRQQTWHDQVSQTMVVHLPKD